MKFSNNCINKTIEKISQFFSKKVLTVLELSCIVLFVRENKTCASGSAVEHLLAKEGVAGSIPVSRFFYLVAEVLIFKDFRCFCVSGKL